ncbi:MAG: putative baseplate assembly protein [Gammaproteobacteria bacterium]
MSDVREQAVLRALENDLRGYTPELVPREQALSHALLKSYSRLAALLDEKLGQVHDRGLLAGFDMLGLHLLPAEAARVPLVFAMQPDSPLAVTLPEGSQVAAKPVPPAPGLEGATPAAGEPVVFSTERAVTLTPARLARLYSLEPGEDRYADHGANPAQGFELFAGMRLTPHHLYLGHDTLFKLGGHIALIVSFALKHGASTPVALVWEYFTDADWIPVPFNPEDDTTGGLMGSGQVTLRHECGPNARKTIIGGRESYWLRARVTTPLLRAGIAPLVTVNDLRVRAAFGKKGLLPDSAYADGIALDVSKDFYPFGQIPTLASAFYVACKDAFERPGATVTLELVLSTNGTVQPLDGTFALEWEYTREDGWASLSVQPADSPFLFERSPQTVLFHCPSDWAELEANGSKQRWLRVRIAKGDYGKPLRVSAVANDTPQFGGGNLAPPIVKTVSISFEYLTDSEPLDHCVVYNDFVYQDVTEAARWPDLSFAPFVPVSGTTPAVHFGFDRALPNGLASLFLDVADEIAGIAVASPYVWEYRAAEGWRELTVLDETSGFRRRGMIQFIGPQDAVALAGLGDAPCYWLRARLKQGEEQSGGRCNGVWINAVWSSDRRRFEREIAGRSDGNPRQSFQLRRTPVLAGETVEVEEWVGRGEGLSDALPEVPASDIRVERDPATNVALAAWVRWHERPHFFDSGAGDRHYVLERATGVVRFGANVPIAGRRIAVNYASGGGAAGNVPAGAAKELRAAVPYLTGVSNVISARGGAECEGIDAVRRRGPQHLRHRGRGIGAQDLEWLALEASPQVAIARCLPLVGPDGRAQRGWFSLLVVPNVLEVRPELNSELARTVNDYLVARMPVGARVQVLPPRYAPVAVRAVIVPVDAALAASTESRVRAALDRFLHPLRGGRDARGWMFGEPAYLSHVAALIESVEGVEHTEEVMLSAQGVLADMKLEIPADQLICSASHELVLRMGAR